MDVILKYFPHLTGRQAEQFAALGALYGEWNAQINVISRKDMAAGEFYVRHVLHSLAIARVFGAGGVGFCGDVSAEVCGGETAGDVSAGVCGGETAGAISADAGLKAGAGSQSDAHPEQGGGLKAGARVVDIGTGGGFPAVPLAIMFPEAEFTAVDSIGKKIWVVREVAAAIGLQNLVAVNGRVEDVAGRFDYAVSRAVAPVSELVRWVWGKIESGAGSVDAGLGSGRGGRLPGGMLLLKGGDLTSELGEAGLVAASGSGRSAGCGKGEYRSFSIAEWFDEDFFETKKVIYIKK